MPIGYSRFVFNHFLAKWQETYEETGKGLSYKECSAGLPSLKKELPWLKEMVSIQNNARIQSKMVWARLHCGSWYLLVLAYAALSILSDPWTGALGAGQTGICCAFCRIGDCLGSGRSYRHRPRQGNVHDAP